MNKQVLFLLLFYGANSFGQNYFEWRTVNEKWIGKDKIIHITGSYVMCAGLNYKFKLRNAMLITSLFNLAWEIKDSWVPSQKVGKFLGGHGFSYTDFVIGNVSILLYAASYIIYKKIKSKLKKQNAKVSEAIIVNINCLNRMSSRITFFSFSINI